MADELYDMSDDELEVAFKAAKAEEQASDETSDEDFDDDGYEQSDDDDDSSDQSDDEDDVDTDEEDDEEGEGEESEAEEEDDESEDEESEDEESEKSTAKDKAEKEPASLTFKAVGKEYTITDTEMREQFPKVFAQAMDYTRKMQAIAPWRKSIDAIENAKLEHSDINLMIDVFKGDKGALLEVMKRTGVDGLDLDPETDKYAPKEYGRDEKALDLEDVIESIRGDEEYRITHDVLTKSWDEASWREFANDPNKIAQLHQDVKTGMYAILQKEADKLKVYDGAKGRDFDYYMAAARQYYTREATNITRKMKQDLEEREKQLDSRTKIAEIEAKSSKREADKYAAGKRRAAAPTGRTTQKKKGVVDYMNVSDEDFEDWYKRLEDRM